MFDYDPTQASSCLPAGTYPAVISKVEEQISKAGNPMLKLTFEAYHGDRKQIVYDYIVNPATLYKLKQLARSLGKLADFEAKKFDAMQHQGESLVLSLKEESDDFGDKNTVKAYKPKDAPTAPADADPDIPF